MKKRHVIIKLISILLFLILLNVASYFLFFRIDFTADKSYTLSKATLNILKNLKEKVTVNAYFSEDLPTQLIKSRNDFKDLLVEYKNYSRGKVLFNFINPNENEPQEKLAQTEGVRPVMVNVSERDQEKQLRAYMGTVIEVNNQKEVIPMVRPGESAEYALTTAIKKLTSKEKSRVAFLQGHGEYPNSALSQVVEQLSVLDSVEDYTLTDTAEIPSIYKTLIMIDPKDSIPPAHFTKLDRYLNNGGNILLAYSNLFGDLNQNILKPLPEIGMRSWLSKMGINLKGEYTVDVQCRRVVKQEPQGTIVIRFPYFPIVKNFADHPATKGIEAVFFPFLNSISIAQKDSAVKITPLAYSSPKSGLIKPPSMIDFNKKWSANDFNKGAQIAVVALEGPIAGKGKSKMIVFANGNFAVNNVPGQEELNKDNVNVVSNAVNWLSDETGLIELRTKGVTYRALDSVEESTKEIIRYLNVVLPILIILIVGLFRRYQNQKTRRKLMETTF
ncbi:MAG TPA: Gldg family protein [Segetibacter sp.]|nr:Gldg family protein [Segetibacter sp.]